MTERYLPPQTNDGLGRMFGVSLGLHLAIGAALALRLVLYPTQPLVLDNAIRVDIVALPDKSVSSALPPPEAPNAPNAPNEQSKTDAPSPVPPTTPSQVEPPSTETAPPKQQQSQPQSGPAPSKTEAPAVNLNKAKREQESALKRLEALNKLEKLAQAKASAPANDSGAAGPDLRAPAKGNELSRGNALTGIARLEHANYLENIDGAVKRHWNLPGWLVNSSLSARVRLFIDSNGVVFKKQLVQSSQNQTYDDRVLAAIESATPLPPPPRNLVNLLAVDGIELEFVPE